MKLEPRAIVELHVDDKRRIGLSGVDLGSAR